MEQPTEGDKIMLTIDVVALITRISNLENENRELRGLIKDVRKELAEGLDEAKQTAYDLIPKSADGKLVFETYDENGDTVYGHVVAEIKSDQADVQ